MAEASDGREALDVIGETRPDVAVIDSARSAASALSHLLEVHGLAAPADAEAIHVQLTTGDVAAFRRIAERLFGDLFPAIEPVAVAGAA